MLPVVISKWCKESKFLFICIFQFFYNDTVYLHRVFKITSHKMSDKVNMEYQIHLFILTKSSAHKKKK